MQFFTFVVAALVPLCALAAPTPTLTVTPVTSTPPTGSTIIDSSPLPSPTPSDNGACNKLVAQCAIDDAETPNGNLRTAFSKTSCVLAFACRAPAENVDAVLYEMWHSKAQYPTALDEPRLSTNIFAQHSTDGKTWSQQNFIDTFYGKLSSLGGPYPISADVVTGYWSNIAAWTGFCATKNIPYQNLADWYSYSSTVKGVTTTC